MSFEYFNPWVLVGLIAAAAVVFEAARSYAGLDRVQGRLHLVLRILTILALLTALSGITWERTVSRAGSDVVLVVRKSPGEKALEFLDSVKASAGPNDRIRQLRLDDNKGISLAEALELAPARLRQDANARVVVVGGMETVDKKALAAAGRLARQGIAVDVVTGLPPKAPNAWIVDMKPDGETRAGMPFDIVVTTQKPISAPPETCFVSVSRLHFPGGTGEGDQALGRMEVPMSASTGYGGRRRYTPSPDLVERSGLCSYVFHAADRSESGPSAEGRVFTWVDPAVQVLIVHDKDTQADDLGRVLSARGMKLKTVAGADLATSGVAWDDYDAVVLLNVPCAALGEKLEDDLRRYVFDGGGLLMVGGPKSFGCGGYYRTNLEKALPVYMDPLREPPIYALIVVLDKSWSMGDAVGRSVHKIDMVREVGIASSAPMAPHDLFGLISFDSQVHVIIELRKISDRELATKTISTLGAFGTTNFYRAMSKARDLLKETKATYKHIVLLSDGRSSVPKLNYETLVAEMKKERITVSTIGVGSDCHRKLLNDIASWGNGKNYHIESTDRIPQLLLEESNRFKEILTVEVPSAVKAALDDPVLGGVDIAGAPKLLGFNRVRAKESADVLLTVSNKDEPLLAFWHYGTGRAAAFASDAGRRWCVDWLEKWPKGYAGLFQEIVASIVRTAPSGDGGIEMESSEGRRELVFTAIDSWGLPVVGRDLTAEVYRGDRTVDKLTMRPAGVGAYRAELARRLRPPYLVRLVNEQGRTCAVRSVPLVQDPPLVEKEAAHRGTELVEAGGGLLNPSPADIFRGKPSVVVRRESIQPTMLILALAFFLLDVVVRRYKAVVRLFAGTGAKPSEEVS